MKLDQQLEIIQKGILEILPQDELIQDITPCGNRFICFKSELPHEVCLTLQTRYSIAGWMKTRSVFPVI